jgi:penicillin-binding protein, 1A family
MAQKKTKKSKKKKHTKRGFILKVILLLFLIMTLGITLFLYAKYGDEIIAAKNDAKALVEASTPDTFKASATSLVYDIDGKQIAQLKGDKDMYYIGLDEIPDAAEKAMIDTEDRKFYSHKGIDLKAVAAAAVSLVKNKGQIKRGGSTITQQLARNIYLNNAKEWSRKIKEMFIALELEKKYSKEQILEFYINNIYFANGYYGLEAASKGYFSKSCSELSLAQITFLCSIPNSPTRYDPIVNYDNTVERKNRILEQMLSEGDITEEEYNQALSEKIELNVPEVKRRNYIETYVTNCAVKALMKESGFQFEYGIDKSKDEGYDEAYSDMYSQCQQQLYRAGYRIYTSIDMSKQRTLQKTINEQLSENKEKGEDGIFEFQGAGVCIDNDNGKVIAVVGGRSQSSITGYTFNRAYQSYRQPGSAIKPIAVYAPAFDNGYDATDIIKDEPIKDGPKNSNGRYMGNISLRTAVEYSVNTVAWKLFSELTPKKCLNYLIDMNFSKLVSEDYTLASSLGGITNGVSPIEMASAYAAIENKGVFREPTCIMAITDSEGNEVVTDDIFDEKRIYDKDAAMMMTDVLRGVLTKGTARGYELDGMSCAGKTGTTNEHKDGWFAGYTPYYTTVIWVGCDTPKSIDNLLGNTYPLYIWNAYMNQIHEGLENEEFERSESSEPVHYNTKEPKETEVPDDYIDEDEDNDDDNQDYEITQPPENDFVPQNPVTEAPVVTEAPKITEAPVITATPVPDVPAATDAVQPQSAEDEQV